MPVKQICRLRNRGLFRDFSWPSELPDFKRFNLIYGWNGSGKTTLSRLFRCIENRTAPTLGTAVVRIDETDIHGTDFPQITLPVRVFNRDFVNESVFPAGGGDVPPIYVVGRENVEKQKEIESLKDKRTKAETDLNDSRGEKRRSTQALDNFCQEQARLIKEALRSAGPNPYNNYNKSDFQARAAEMVNDGNAASHLLSDEQYDNLYHQVRSPQKPKVAEVAYRPPDLQALCQDAGQLLSKTVAASAIQRLKDDQLLAEWVRQGLNLHRTHHGDTCLFCERPLPAGHLTTLEAHFSAAYEELQQALDRKAGELRELVKQADEIAAPATVEVYDEFASQYDMAKEQLLNTAEAIKSCVEGIIQALGNKKSNPFECLSLNVNLPSAFTGAVEGVNEIIRQHNGVCERFEERVNAARDRLALSMIARSLDDYSAHRETAKKAEDAVASAREAVDRYTGEIQKLEREIVQHRAPAEELNEDLCRYLGHGDLQLEVKDTGYSITRNGEHADFLSEGETTAIALLYFLKSLEGRDFDLRNGMVVLDDPVSSLDQKAMFAGFAYLRERTQVAKQVVIMTHNFMFFRLVREWFGNLRGDNKRNWSAFMLECDTDANGRATRLRRLDPLLMDFDSEYHYLFSRLYRMATEPPVPSLEAYFGAPFIARRVVEMFLAFRVPDMGGHSRLWSQMQAIDFEEARRSRIYRFMQTHSHRDAVGDADEDMTMLGESRSVLNDVIAFLREADPEHVSRMVACVSEGNGDEGG